MLYKLIIIGKNTFTETLRQPIYTVIISFALLLFLMSPSVTMYTMDEDIKLLREIGLSTLFLVGLFIATFSATSAVTEEVETKTITTVLSKPIGRPTFIVGKFIGLAAALFLSHYICTIAMIFAVRHGVLETVNDTHDWPVIVTATVILTGTFLITAFLNYTYDWNFPATAISLLAVFATLGITFLLFIDREWQFNPENNGIELFDVYASVLLLLAVMVLVALAVLFSTRLNVVLTILCCTGTFLLGLITDWVFGRFADSSLLARAGTIAIPNLQVFWVSDAIYEGSSVSFGYLLAGALYAALYTGGILCLAIAFFQRRQIG